MTAYWVRPATERDVRAVRGLRQRVRRELRSRQPVPAADPEGTLAWVVEAGRGEIVGCCAVRQATAATWEVETLYLTPEWRGFGLGRALLEQAVRVARQHGALSLHLPVNGEADAAAGLARRLGFAEESPAAGEMVLRLGAAS